MHLLIVCAFAFVDDAKPFRYVLTQGEQFGYVSTQSRTTTVEAGKRKFTFTNDQELDVTWHVDSVDAEGIPKLTQTIDRLKLSMRGEPIGTFVFDSARDDNPERVQPLLDALKSHEFKFAMKSNGETASETAVGEFVKKIKFKEGDKVMPQIAAELERAFFQPTLHLPDKPLKPGDGWDLKPYSYKQGNNTISAETRIEFVGPKRIEGNKSLEFRRLTTWSLVPATNDGKSPSTKITEQESEGILHLDPDTRRLVDSKWSERIVTTSGTGKTRIRYETQNGGTLKLKAAGDSKGKKEDS